MCCVLDHLHLADAFIQSDLQGCIHIFTFTLMAHCTSGAIRGSVSCSRTLRQGIELATFDFSTSCTTATGGHSSCLITNLMFTHRIYCNFLQTPDTTVEPSGGAVVQIQPKN